MTIYLQFFRWAIHWQVGGFDPGISRCPIAVLTLRKNHRAWRGWGAYWDERPDWKRFPTNGALRIEHTVQGKTTAYVFRGPIERIPAL